MSTTELWIPITEWYREWLYVFVPVRTRRCRRRRHRPQTFVHEITSEQLFGFLSFLVRIMTLTCRLDYLIRFLSIFVLTLTLNLIFKVKYGICYNATTDSLMATKRKANIVCTLGLKRDNEIWPWPWPWPKIFPVKYEICHTSSPQPNMVQLPWNEKQTFRSNSNQQMQSSGLTLAMTLTLDFQGQILKQPYLRNRRANWQWTIGGHSWPWPWLFCDQDEA